MFKLNERGVIAQFLVFLILAAGIGVGIYLVQTGNLKLFSKAANPPIVFKSLDGNSLSADRSGIVQTSSLAVKVEITSTLGPPVAGSGTISGPVGKGTVAYRVGFSPEELSRASFLPYTVEPAVNTVVFKNTREVQFYWVEFKAANGTTDRRLARIQVIPKSVSGFSGSLEVGLEAGAQSDTSKVNLVAESKAKWVRLNFIGTNWSANSTTVQNYNKIIDAYKVEGVNILGLIGAESVNGGYDRTHPETFTQKYVDTTDAIIDRFGDRVKVYELFNEPNDWAGDSSAQVAPQWFAEYLGKIYRRIKIEQNKKDIIFNSGPIFSHDQDTGASYLEATYTEGKKLSDPAANWENIKRITGSYPLDGIGYHIYVVQGMNLIAVVPSPLETKIKENLTAVESVINKFDPGKKIWISEFGWGTGAGRVTEDVQAANLEKAYAIFKSDPAIRMAMWFTLMDFDANEKWGLVRKDGTKKKAWYSFLVLTGAR